ncbi:hypothetical protein N0V88_002999 [Collariella sp. IMI 366227]|nr:hypothetical protein N0V88_002999 [Collariella sp. IMI 366227]
MTSSGSSKDLAKALNGFLQAPTLPLPTEINRIIAIYLEKHERPDEGSGERLGDELLTIWEKVVHDHPEKYAAFLAILRELRLGLRTPARVFKWWDKLLDPVLDNVGLEKGLAREAMDHTLDLLAADEYDDPAAWSEQGLTPLVNRLLKKWVEVRENQGNIGASTELKEQMIKDALLAFGKRDPKGFMFALDGFVVKREHRNSALSLLCAFTPLFGNILHSLQKDESTATINLALVALVMILPFIPSSLVPFLPTLFNVYARLLFWDRDSYFTQQHTEMGADNCELGGGVPWDKSLLDPDYDGHSISYLPEYFTLLYGLYPINFLDYIRKPQRYLRHANNAEDIDVQAMEIRDRSDRFRKQHLLHPNFYNLTIESEKTDMSRWIKSEADEVLADCMALVTEQAPGFGHVHLHHFSATALSKKAPTRLCLETQSMPTFYPPKRFLQRRWDWAMIARLFRQTLADRHPRAIPPNAIETSSFVRSGLRQSLANDSVPSLLLSPQDQVVEKPSPQLPTAQTLGRKPSFMVDDQVALLQHHRLRLINDLQYERFIKQQHMIHMGELRRRQIRVSATEAETQNLVMANRSLRQRFDEAKRGEAQIRKEFDHRRNMSKKWESDLSGKLKVLREEQKKWTVEGSDLRQQLEKAQAECDSLRQIIEEAEKKRVESEQNLEAVDSSTAMIEKLKGEIARLNASEREYQGKEVKIEADRQAAAVLEARAQQTASEIAAREDQLQQIDEGELSPPVRGPFSPRSRPRGFSDPEVGEGLATPGAVSSPPELASAPLSPLGKNGSQTERYFGRGGVQNAAKKEKKSRKEDKEEKKDKKSGAGFMAIRGFV